MLQRPSLQRLDGAGGVVVNHGVELMWKRCVEVMARPLGGRHVDDADGALETLELQRLRCRGVAAQGKPEVAGARSEERRVGKECRSRWSPYH